MKSTITYFMYTEGYSLYEYAYSDYVYGILFIYSVIY